LRCGRKSFIHYSSFQDRYFCACSSHTHSVDEDDAGGDVEEDADGGTFAVEDEEVEEVEDSVS
jgi:hypothetical protein